MRKKLPKLLQGLLIFALLLTVTVSWGQTRVTFFSENMGTPSGTTAIAANNFQNTTNPVTIVYSGTGDVRTSTPSSTYTGFSAGGNVFITNTGTPFFQMAGINTIGYTNILLSFGQHKSSTAGTGSDLIAEYSTDGTDYTAIPYSRASGNGTANWILISPTATLPSTSNLRIRFRQTGTTTQYRIDDVKLTGIAASTAPTVSTSAINDATGITTTSAEVPGGNVTASGGETVTARGIVWGTATTPTLDNNVLTAAAGGTGIFTVADLTSLSSNTRYYYRAYATNSVGTSYGTEYSFFTKALTPGVPVVGAANRTVNSLSVLLNANGNNAATTYSIRVNSTNYVQEDGSVGTQEYFQSATAWGTTVVTGLNAGTSYSFDSSAKTAVENGVTGNNTPTAYGPAAVESTLPATSPTLIAETTSLNFGGICVNASATQSFTFTGTNISGNATLTVAQLSGYTYSSTENGTYTATLTIENFTGSATTVWVHFNPSAVQNYDGNIYVNGVDANASAQLTIITSGEGVNTPGTVATGATTGITQTSVVLAGTATASACSTFSAYGFEYGTVSGFTNGTVVPASNLSGAAFSAAVSSLAPGTTYFYKAYGTDAAGTHYGTEQSFTTGTLTQPVATTATNIAQTSFTANWDAVEGATSYRLDVATNSAFRTGSLATDLFFSEYVEGSGTNKALEIYNGTGAAVDLSNYRVSLYTNGSSAVQSSVVLSGILGNAETFVIATSNTIYSNANLINSTVTSYNGDDAIALIKISTGNYVDIIGRIGSPDPGNQWSADGGISTLDKTLVRKSNITGGVTVNPATGFPMLGSEWEVHPTDTFSYLGSHTFDYANYYVSGYENKIANGTSETITGLNPYTNYYYRVRAFSTNSTSANSNIANALTKPATVTWTGTPAAWVPAVALDNTINAVIDANYVTGSNGVFTAKSITLNTGRTFTVTRGTTITVEENIINDALPANFVVENNAALLQGTDIENTANITVVKNSNELFRLDYTLWASPVSGLSLGDFSRVTSTGRFYEYKYDLDTTLGTSVEQYFIVPPTTLFEEAKGYLIRMPNGNLDVPGYNAGTAAYSFKGIFTGTPNNGPVSKPASTQGYRYTAVGNPYPSPISVAAFFSANSGVLNETSGLYFWRKRNGATTSSYATLTLAGYAASQEDEGYVPVESTDPGGQGAFYNGAESSWLISQGQGFIVKTSATPTVTEITFNNSMRRPAPASGNQAFFRTAASTRSRLWLNLKDSQQNFSQATIAYINNATTSIDYGYDGAMLNDGGRVALFSLAANTTLAIQARPSFTATDVVPMGFNAIAAGQFTLSISHADGLFELGQDVFIKDNLLGTVTSLDTPYTFTSEAGTFNQRFEVVYTADILDTDAPVLNANSVIVYKEGNAINITTGTVQITGVTVYDINGRKLYTKTGIEAATASIDNLQVASQVLIIEVNTAKGKVSKRIVF